MGNLFKNLFSGAANKAIIGVVGPALTGFALDLANMLPGANAQMTVKEYIGLAVAFIINGLLVYVVPNKPAKA